MNELFYSFTILLKTSSMIYLNRTLKLVIYSDPESDIQNSYIGVQIKYPPSYYNCHPILLFINKNNNKLMKENNNL